MSELNIYLTTFNCGREPIHTDYFATNFFNGLTTNLPPDLVVLSLEEIAPISYSFIGGSLLAPYFSRFTTAIAIAATERFETETEYAPLLVRNVGMTAIMVFAKRNIEERIRWIETAGVGVGRWEMGNKGAVAARLGLDSDGEETVVTFVAAHMAPMEDAWQRRGADWKSICQGLVFEKFGSTYKTDRAKAAADGGETEPLLTSTNESASNEQKSLFSPISHVFFSGDLNYRTSDTGPNEEDWKNWPQPVDSVSDVRHYSHLLEKDQLQRELRKNNTLHLLAEAEIAFSPTYKYSQQAQDHAAGLASKKLPKDDDHAWLWAKHRVPSWCDRTLYLAAAPPTVHSYTSLPIQPTSDHRPVTLSLSIPFRPIGPEVKDIKPPFPIREDWREARAAARRYELVVGIATYLALTWEGEALLVGTFFGIVGGYLALQVLIAT